MNQPQVHIARLTLQESGTYNRQFSRPYEVVTTNDRMGTLSTMEDRIQTVSHQNPNATINRNLLSGIASNLVVPAAAYSHELVIPNGWNERRLRFVLEVHINDHFGTNIYFFQGFTDYPGITANGIADPKMPFIINSFIKINRAQDFSGINSTGFRDVITEAYQVVNGQFHAQYNNATVYGLRPEDLFAGVQSNYIGSIMDTYGDLQIGDSRTNKANTSIRSRRSNGIPSSFLTKVVDTYRSASMLSDFGSGSDDIYSRAINTCYEGTVHENPFIRLISNITGFQNATIFTLENLAAIDPGVGARTEFHQMANTVHLHRVGDTNDNWMQPTLETQLATIATHAVSGLMVENLFVSMGFHTTTLTLNGQPVTQMFPGAQGVTTADMRPYVNKFIQQFEMEVLPDLTMNWTVPLDMVVVSDLYGETRIEISIDGRPHEVFVTPSFCDSLMVPVVTTNTNDYNSLVVGIEEVMNHCGTSAQLTPMISPVDTSV